MSETLMRAILQDLAREGIPAEEIDLWPRLSGELAEDWAPTRRKTLPRAWQKAALPLILVLALMLISVILIGPERALAALRGLLGYIPGIGLVDDSAGLRALENPVSLERDGITVTVEQAVLDGERTVVVYQVDGIPAQAYARDVPEAPRGQAQDVPLECSASPSLRLGDGMELRIVEGGGSGWPSGYHVRLVFPAVPLEVDEATFFIPCLDNTSPGAAPEDWELALQFVPAPPELTVLPVIEIAATPEPPAMTERAPETGLYLERVIELEDSYILIGSFRQGEDLPGAMLLGISNWPLIADAEGRPVPFEFPSDLRLESEQAGIFRWAYQIPKGFRGPLTITFESVDVEIPADATFQLDTGPEPQVGQEWRVDRDLLVDGRVVRLVSAVRLAEGLELHFAGGPLAAGVQLEDVGHAPTSGFGGGGPEGFTIGFNYAEPIPTGVFTFRIRALVVRHPGPWTLAWQPPEGNELAPTLVVPQACLTLDRWLRIVDNPPAHPEGLPGKLIAYGRIQEDGQRLSPQNAGVFIVDLESGTRQILGPGTWPALSPDGARAAYSGADGLHVVDIAFGEDQILPGTSEGDYNPRWSPDGTQLAFVRTEDLNLYVANADGSNLRRVTEGPEYELLVGWMADGQTLVYAFPGPQEGMPLQFLELPSGTVREGFMIDRSKGLDAAISPDGQSIAYSARLPGSMEYGLYLSDLDGSDQRLIAQLGARVVAYPVWSPDGAWLTVNITNPDLRPTAVPALINLDTCEAFPLDGIDGDVQGWSP